MSWNLGKTTKPILCMGKFLTGIFRDYDISAGDKLPLSLERLPAEKS
ncbi:hypothetical protein SS05631_b61870 (plasmid) [Sinorhizobium sp. CCBAU 05631]|nr:hypothetical protein SS05631_b61870 [Sinorhizobium sp. CCBAU 05631]